MIRAVAFLCLLASPLAAHPHIFVDTGLEVVVDAEGRVTHLRVTWEYDELYTLLITEDYGVDQDYDGVLSPADREIITGFDMNWVAGFNGDLEVAMDGQPVELSGPADVTTDLVEGKLVTTHLRTVAGDVALTQGVLSLRPYDVTYYTAYEVNRAVIVTGRNGCGIDRKLPDIDAALAQTQEELAALPTDADAEAMGFPEIGARFATEIRISCPAAS